MFFYHLSTLIMSQINTKLKPRSTKQQYNCADLRLPQMSLWRLQTMGLHVPFSEGEQQICDQPLQFQMSLCSFKGEAKEQETSWFENSFKTALYVLNCRYGNTINPICAHSEWLTMPVWAECCLEMTLNLLWTQTKIRPCHFLFCSSLAKALKVRFKKC